jgi:23S rRNA pseudouridine1911/1915/1917 synthase
MDPIPADDDRGSGRTPSSPNHGWTYRDVVPATAAGWAVECFYARTYPHSDAATWIDRLARGQVEVDARRARSGQLLQPGQVLTWHRPPWSEAAVPLSFAVLHLDPDVLAVAKPAGLPALPGGGFLEHTLLHQVQRRWGRAVVPAHRLGRGTSGVMLFARTERVRAQLAAGFAADRVERLYHALVSGTDVPDEFVVDVPVGRVAYPGLGWLHAAATDGKPARSHCRVLERRPLDRATVVEVRLHTGRAHQIRIHLAAAGWPLVGDPLYEPGGLPRRPSTTPPALPGDTGYWLHAHRLVLPHPAHGGLLAVTCPPPAMLRLTPA